MKIESSFQHQSEKQATPLEVEIVSLNLVDLDITELEQRLELASTAPNAGCWIHDNCPCDVLVAA